MKTKQPKKILLLGATGSIGQQTLDVIRSHPDLFVLTGVSAGSDVEGLKKIVQEFDTIETAGISALDHPENFQNEDGELVMEGVPLVSGENQMEQLCREADYDVLVNAVVGFRGLLPTLSALERDKDVALANKESMVCGGELVKEAWKKSKGTITPIDSEHSAIFQCLQGSRRGDIKKLLITASGGSLRDLSRDQLHDITPARALAHPSWNMGKRITIDSATMVNKGFEVIEAHYLFDIPYEQIEPVLHPQSLVHSMVQFQDNAILAQMGSADMRLPIQYALTVPERPVLEEEHPMDFARAFSLDFKPMDYERFPMLALAVQAARQKGNRGTVFNAADEEAVALFLKEQISFLDIEKAIEKALETVENIENPTYEELKKSDELTRDYIRSLAWAKDCLHNTVLPSD